MGSIDVGQTITVTVEKYLSDIILVSFNYDEKLYQGILLDSTKNQFPCGVYAKNILSSTNDVEEDSLYSVKQRHTYIAADDSKLPLKKGNGSCKKRNAPMTVRLRPRQVLCSNCQSICNEKSENVSSRKATKSPSNVSDMSSSPEVNNSKNSPSNSQSLVPKLVKLRASDIETATGVGFGSVSNEVAKGSSTAEITVTNTQSFASDNSDKNGFDISNKPKLPKLKLISSLPSGKCKGRIPRMTISTSIANKAEVKECAIRTRSRGSVDDIAKEITKIKQLQTGNYDTNVKFNQSTNNNELLNNKEKKEDFEETLSEPTIKTNKVTENYDSIKITLPLNSKEADSSNSEIKMKIEKSEKMNLRKKRAIGLMEDLWDETIFDETKKFKGDDIKDPDSEPVQEDKVESIDPNVPKSNAVPVLKIFYGSGKATVLKIHPKSSLPDDKSENTEPQDEMSKKAKSGITKAARKALRRARKEALRRSMAGHPPLALGPNSKFEGKSPLRIGGISPARRGFPSGRFGGASPGRFGSGSPGRFGNVSPGRFGGASPGRFGGASPGRFGPASPGKFGGSSTSIVGGIVSSRVKVDTLIHTQSKRHKHKVKHKKKHKEGRRHKSDENIEPSSTNSVGNKNMTKCSNTGELYEKDQDSKDKETAITKGFVNTTATDSCDKQNILQNTRHKLSISIKRVNNASYVTCDPNKQLVKKPPMELIPATIPLTSDKPKNQEPYMNKNNFSPQMPPCFEENSDYLNHPLDTDTGSDPNHSSEEFGSEVPDFPFVAVGVVDEDEATRLFMTLEWHDVESCEVSEVHFKVGDIVWGKADNFPWWPAKIKNLKVLLDSAPNSNNWNQAQVGWYGTTSLTMLPMQRLQHFINMFNTRYKTHGETAYQNAVQEAKSEAVGGETDNPQIGGICDTPITASPREVDVIS